MAAANELADLHHERAIESRPHPNRQISCAHSGSVPFALTGSTVAVDDCSFRLCSAIRNTQLHAANILGEASTVIERVAQTSGSDPRFGARSGHVH